MAERIASNELNRIATVTDAPARTKVVRSFELPNGLYVATAAAYLAFLGLMSLLFMNSELAIPITIMAGFIVVAFGICGLWTSMKPDNDNEPLTGGQFSHRGIQTLSGPLTAGEATVQVLILPVLILVWGFAIAVIVAFH
ncbi:MAG: hypothetical protein KDE55_05035 [Novosphingobium sp.]|nr:hypothetical protein [Novosphingobium sp.]